MRRHPTTETLLVVIRDVGMSDNPVRWLLWNPPVRERLSADVDHGPSPTSVDAVQGENGYGTVGYDDPAAPGSRHATSFEAYALPGRLDVDGGAGYTEVKRACEQFDRTAAGFTAVYLPE